MAKQSNTDSTTTKKKQVTRGELRSSNAALKREITALKKDKRILERDARKRAVEHKRELREARKGRRRPRRVRALTAYMLFVKSERDKITAEFPGEKFADIGRRLGATWRALDETQRAHWDQLAEAEKARVAEEKAAADAAAAQDQVTA